MTDYESKENLTGRDKAMKMAAAAGIALCGLAWQIAQNVIIRQGTDTLDDFFDKLRHQSKNE